LLGTFNDDGKLLSSCSGTVIDPAGYILTNWHCVGPTPGDFRPGKVGERFHTDGLLAVAPTIDPHQPPPTLYVAQVLAGSPRFDLAVLKIIFPAAKNTRLPDVLPLAVTPLGDSDKVKVGDPLSIFGYPGSGGKTVTYSGGSISGFKDWDNDGTPDSFKYDAKGGHGQSGGLVTNDRGEQIAVHNSGSQDNDPTNDRFGGGIMINVAKPFVAEAIRAGGQAVGLPVNAPKLPGLPPSKVVSPPTPSPRTGSGTGGANPPVQQAATISGTVVDFDTKKAISGAVFALLKEGVSLDQFTSAQDKKSLILTAVETDVKGAFTTSPVTKGKSYVVLAVADGYQTRTAGIDVPAAAGDVIRLDKPFELKKQ
jgi:serine protease Do